MLGSTLRIGGGGLRSTLMCGKFAFDESFARPLTDLLPPIVHLGGERSQTPALRATVELL
jgi:hypothetical protein